MRTTVRGIVAGVVAGVVAGSWSSASMGMGGRGWLRPMNLIAHIVWRAAPTDDRFDLAAVVVAAVTLVVVGVAALLPFAGLATGAGLSPVMVVGGGAAYLNVVWIIGEYVVWPKLDPYAAHAFPAGVAWAAHLAAGAVAGVVLVARHDWLARGTSRVRHLVQQR